MVTITGLCPTLGPELLGVQQAAEPLIQRLEPSRRVAVLMALLGIVIVGIFFVAIVLLGANWARRLARHSPKHKSIDGRKKPPHRLDRSNGQPPAAKTSDTIEVNRNSTQTKANQ